MRHAILLFVKLPVAGKVKTRLAVTVGAERAAEIYRELVAAVCARLPRDAEVIAMFDPPEERDAVVRWLIPLLPATAKFWAQSPGDLGARLERAFEQAFAAGCEVVTAIGSDCIEFSPEVFAAAAQAVQTHDLALGPTPDGGYYLLTLRRPSAELFHQIPWSSAATFSATMARAHELDCSVFLLPEVRDVDTEEDWNLASQAAVASALVTKLDSAGCD